MCGGGGAKEGGIEAGGDDSYSMRTRALIDDGGCLCPSATVGPHSRLFSIQQSTNLLCNRTTLLKLETLIILYVYSLV